MLDMVTAECILGLFRFGMKNVEAQLLTTLVEIRHTSIFVFPFLLHRIVSMNILIHAIAIQF